MPDWSGIYSFEFVLDWNACKGLHGSIPNISTLLTVSGEKDVMDKPNTRLCLACKGKKFVFNYTTQRFTTDPCKFCDENGRLPYESHDDGYGPFRYVQHRITTEIYRGKTSTQPIFSTTDIKNPMIRAEDQIVLKAGVGIYTVDELLGVCSLLERLMKVGDVAINCKCCKQDKRIAGVSGSMPSS